MACVWAVAKWKSEVPHTCHLWLAVYRAQTPTQSIYCSTFVYCRRISSLLQYFCLWEFLLQQHLLCSLYPHHHNTLHLAILGFTLDIHIWKWHRICEQAKKKAAKRVWMLDHAPTGCTASNSFSFSPFLFDRRQLIAGAIVVVVALDVWQAVCKYCKFAAWVMEWYECAFKHLYLALVRRAPSRECFTRRCSLPPHGHVFAPMCRGAGCMCIAVRLCWCCTWIIGGTRVLEIYLPHSMNRQFKWQMQCAVIEIEKWDTNIRKSAETKNNICLHKYIMKTDAVFV